MTQSIARTYVVFVFCGLTAILVASIVYALGISGFLVIVGALVGVTLLVLSLIFALDRAGW